MQVFEHMDGGGVVLFVLHLEQIFQGVVRDELEYMQSWKCNTMKPGTYLRSRDRMLYIHVQSPNMTTVRGEEGKEELKMFRCIFWRSIPVGNGNVDIQIRRALEDQSFL